MAELHAPLGTLVAMWLVSPYLGGTAAAVIGRKEYREEISVMAHDDGLLKLERPSSSAHSTSTCNKISAYARLLELYQCQAGMKRDIQHHSVAQRALPKPVSSNT